MTVNFNELPFCVSQKGERGDMHEKPEKRDVVDDINPAGGHDNEKTADMHEKPDKRDIDSNFDFDFDSEYDEDVIETVETQVHKRPEKRDGASSSSIAYYSPLLKQRLSGGMLNFQL
jgi:hypothetical protein